MKKRIYISGPITGIPFNNIKEFMKAEKYYQKMGYEVINPHNLALDLKFEAAYYNKPFPTEKEIIGHVLKEALKNTDIVALLPNAKDSVGTNTELFSFMQYNIPVVEAYTDKPLEISANVEVNYCTKETKFKTALKSA